MHRLTMVIICFLALTRHMSCCFLPRENMKIFIFYTLGRYLIFAMAYEFCKFVQKHVFFREIEGIF